MEEVYDRVAGDRPALHQHRPDTGCQQRLAGAAEAVGIGDGDPGQRLGLGRVGRDQRGAGHELAQGLERRLGDQARAALGDHHRIDHQRDVRPVRQRRDYRLGDIRIAQHAGLDRVSADIAQHHADLGGDHLGRDGMHTMDAARVLDGG